MRTTILYTNSGMFNLGLSPVSVWSNRSKKEKDGPTEPDR